MYGFHTYFIVTRLKKECHNVMLWHSFLEKVAVIPKL